MTFVPSVPYRLPRLRRVVAFAAVTVIATAAAIELDAVLAYVYLRAFT